MGLKTCELLCDGILKFFELRALFGKPCALLLHHRFEHTLRRRNPPLRLASIFPRRLRFPPSLHGCLHRNRPLHKGITDIPLRLLNPRNRKTQVPTGGCKICCLCL